MNPQEAAVCALKTMWRKRYDEAEQRVGDIASAAVMTSEWRDTLDRLVTLRAEMREIAHALGWAEKGFPWHGLTAWCEEHAKHCQGCDGRDGPAEWKCDFFAAPARWITDALRDSPAPS